MSSEEEEEEEKEEKKEEEESASMEGDLNQTAQFEGGSERSPAPASKPTAEKQQGEVAETSGANQKKNKAGLKVQGLKDLMHVKKRKKSPPPSPALALPSQKESAQQKLRKLMSGKSVSDKSHGRSGRGGEKAETAPISSDSSDAPPPASFRKKSKGKEAPSSPSPSSSSSSGAVARDDEAKPDCGPATVPGLRFGRKGQRPRPVQAGGQSGEGAASLHEPVREVPAALRGQGPHAPEAGHPHV